MASGALDGGTAGPYVGSCSLSQSQGTPPCLGEGLLARQLQQLLEHFAQALHRRQGRRPLGRVVPLLFLDPVDDRRRHVGPPQRLAPGGSAALPSRLAIMKSGSYRVSGWSVWEGIDGRGERLRMGPPASIGAAHAASGEPVVVDRRCEMLRAGAPAPLARRRPLPAL